MSPFQTRVRQWMRETFAADVCKDDQERAFRFGEEALEALQAGGLTKEQVLKIADYVYGRPVGEFRNEVGGTLVTLAAWCDARGVDMMECGESEQTRIESPEVRARIQAKQEYKRTQMQRGDPLPGISPDAPQWYPQRGNDYTHKDGRRGTYIAPHPHDGALYIFNELDREDDDIMVFFACERHDLQEMPKAPNLFDDLPKDHGAF